MIVPWVEQEAALLAHARSIESCGTPIDPGIIETVVVLWGHRFPTIASCEGLLHNDEPFPWVDVSVRLEPGDTTPLRETPFSLANRKNFVQEQRMLELLEDFYQDRRPSLELMLIVVPHSDVHGFTLRSQGAHINMIRDDPEDRLRWLRLFREEMAKFTEFLRGILIVFPPNPLPVTELRASEFRQPPP